MFESINITDDCCLFRKDILEKRNVGLCRGRRGNYLSQTRCMEKRRRQRIVFLETATALVCLSHAIFWEARSESTIAQLAVAQVVINRVNDHRYPDNVCAVVTQGQRYTWNNKLVPNKSQFRYQRNGTGSNNCQPA